LKRAHLLFLVPILALAGTSSHVLTFSRNDFGFSRYAEYDVIEHVRGYLAEQTGLPALPYVSSLVAIPAHARVVSVEAEPLSTEELPGEYNIVPVQTPRPISTRDDIEFVLPDPNIYGSDTPYPLALVDNARPGNAGGIRLGGFGICPFSYTPAEHKLFLHTRIRVTVTWQDHAVQEHTPTPAQRQRTINGLQDLVLNQEDLDRLAPRPVATDLPQIDLLVITSDLLAPEFQPYLEYRTRRGIRTELRTAEWVERNYPGRDLQERMRNMVRDYYEHRGLSYLLLAGDNRLVPSRRIRVYVGNTRGDVPTDLYFGDLDFSWDSNNNNLFGEMSDEVDLFADVIVGRASVDNRDQVRNFIDKVKTYEQDPAPDYVRRCLLPSGWLWRSSGYHGRFVNDSIADLTPSGWQDLKMVNPGGSAVVADTFDNGFALFDPAGHGNEQGVYDENGTSIYTSSFASRQTNDRRFTIMTSLACTPGNFEAEDCIAELSHNCVRGGCIAVMMNSRYGWGTPPSMGPSEKLCVRYYDHYFNFDQHVIGVAHSRSREVYAPTSQWNSLWRWCMTEFNLLGDPCLDVWTEPPSALQVACGDTVIQTGQQNLEVSVTGTDGPVENALVCAWKDGEVFATANSNASGTAALDIHPVTPGELSVTATAHDWLPDSQTVTVTQGRPEPMVVFVRSEISDQGQQHENGILEPGETGQLTLVVFNSGLAPATNAVVTLQALGQGISLPDSVADLGTIGHQDSASTSSLAIAADPDVRPGSAPEVLATVFSSEATWEFVFPVNIGYPGRTVADIDTSACALSVTARGQLGFDTGDGRKGRGFRFPKTDTSSLNTASLCIGNSADYVVDRFYTLRPGRLDTDWALVDSIRAEAPKWNSRQLLVGRFDDSGHPEAKGISVLVQALGTDAPDHDRYVILVYDITNTGQQPVPALYSGILADFDVVATDRFHDLACCNPELRTVFMRNVNRSGPWCGVKQLYPPGSSYLSCIDHRLYVYPDSGLSEDMKYRALKGLLGDSCTPEPYNWSLVVSSGPFNMEPGNRQRVAFAFVAAEDSASFLDACRNAQEWFQTNVGFAESPAGLTMTGATIDVFPNPFARSTRIRLGPALDGNVSVQAFDLSGRLAQSIYTGSASLGRSLTWTPRDLAAGVYILKLTSDSGTLLRRVVLAD
jgi:hypothetical protein